MHGFAHVRSTIRFTSKRTVPGAVLRFQAGGGDSDSDRHPQGRRALPSTVEEAVKFLVDELPLKDKVAIANANAQEVGELTISLIHVIRHAFSLESGNHALW